MAGSVIQVKGTLQSNTASTVSTTLTATTSGNLIAVCIVGCEFTATSVSITDNLGQTYTHVTAADAAYTGVAGRAPPLFSQIWYCQNSSSITSVTATVSPSAIPKTLTVYEVSGMLQSGTIVDVTSTKVATTSGSSLASTAVTTTGTNGNFILQALSNFGQSSSVTSSYILDSVTQMTAYLMTSGTISSSTTTFSYTPDTACISTVAFFVAPPVPSGTIATTESSDIMSGVGSESPQGNLSSTESTDIMSSSGFLPITGTITSTEGSDTFGGTGLEQIAALTDVGVQYFSITIASGQTQGTATINQVGAGAFILWDGNNPSISNNPAESSAYGTLTNSTTITATRNTGTAGTVTYYGCIVDGDLVNLIESVQYGTVTLSSTSNTATINSVTNANTAIHLLGWTSTNIALTSDSEFPVLSLSGTTVTATRPTATGTLTVGFVVIEFQGSALATSVQNVAASSSSSVTSYTATLGTAVILANTMSIYAGSSIATVTTNIAEAKQRSQLTGTTTVTVSINTAVADAKKYNCSIVQFVPPILNSAVQRNTTTLTGATSGSTTITSVHTAFAALSFLGNTATATTALLNETEGASNLASSTSVTTTKNTSTANITSSWEVVEFSTLPSVRGTFASTESTDTFSGSGLQTITGTMASTEDPDVMAATGAMGSGIGGSMASTESVDTMSASGIETITGTMSPTESTDIMAASGSELFSGSMASIESTDVMSATGAETFTGSMALTEAADNMSASGIILITGSMASTESTDTMSASGKQTITGSMASTETTDVMAASGIEKIIGSASITESADTMSASAQITFTGTMAVTEAADTFAAQAVETFLGSMHAQEAGDSFTANGLLTISGVFAAFEAGDSMNAVGLEVIEGIFASAEDSDVMAAIGFITNPPALAFCTVSDRALFLALLLDALLDRARVSDVPAYVCTVQ